MFDELNKYNQQDHFFFKRHDSLGNVCNAPTNKSGVYLVYARSKGKSELIFIGCSGRHLKNNTMFIRKAGIGGMKDRIVNGHQFGKIRRRISWPNQMKKEGIEALEIYWYVTHFDKYSDCPRTLKHKLLKKHLELYGRLPMWNKK